MIACKRSGDGLRLKYLLAGELIYGLCGVVQLVGEVVVLDQLSLTAS
jgi:hypothetical protein